MNNIPKRSFLIYVVSLILLTGVLKGEERPRGWHIVNTTAKKIGVAWYESALASKKSSSFLFALFLKKATPCPTGNKIVLSEPSFIEPGSSLFLVQPSGGTTDSFKQLIITQNLPLLTTTVIADEVGIPREKELFVFDSTTHEDLQKPFLQYLPLQPRLYIGQPKGSKKLVLLSHPELLDKDSLFEEGWHLSNCASKTLYAGWYQTSASSKDSSSSETCLGKDQHLIVIESQETIPLSYPITSPHEPPYKLIASFNRELLTQTISEQESEESTQYLEGISKNRLGQYGTTWRVFEDKGIPSFVPHYKLFHLINTLNKPVYCAFYYTNAEGAQKYGPQELITEILPQHRIDLHYPDSQRGTFVHLLVTHDKEKLYKKKLASEEWQEICHKDFTSTTLPNWYVDESFLVVPHRYNPQNLYIQTEHGGFFERFAKKTLSLSTMPEELVKEFEEKLDKQAALYMTSSEALAAKEKPSVLTCPAQKVMEHEFLAKRRKVARKAINALFGEELLQDGDVIPSIALVFTGGGYRAMTETIGFIQGAADTMGGNIFDCCSFMMGLSGSTWAINPLVASGLSPDQFAEQQKYKVGEGGMIPLHRLISNLITESSDYLEKRFIQGRYGQFCGPIGLYGHALAHALLSGFSIDGKGAHFLTLSDLRTQLQEADYPLPISVSVEPGNHDKERIWYEFSPYYCGTYQEQGSWINTKLAGTIFSNGSPLHILPEYPLAYFMGIWGSAFALSTDDIAKESTVGGFISRACSKIGVGFGEAYKYLFSGQDRTHALGRATAGNIPNYNYRREEALERVSTMPVLRLIDGGITKEGTDRHNFASIPALWRDVDILIMCDSQSPTGDRSSIEHLLASDEEARHQRLPFPNLTRSTQHRTTLNNVPSKVASLFVEKGSPLVVYIQAKNNTLYNGYLAEKGGPYEKGFDRNTASFIATSNFSYTPEQFDVLCGLTKSIFIQSKDTIKKAISLAIEKHKKKP